METKLPEGWERNCLGNICNIAYGKDFRKKNLAAKGDLSVYGANGVIGYHDQFTHENEMLLIGCRGSVGFTRFTKPKSFITHNCLTLEPYVEMEKRFLKYAIDASDLRNVITGSSQPQITISNIEKLNIVFPKKEIQERIADKLDSLLAKVKDAQSRLDKIPTIPKQFRQSILASAFSGELTKDWRKQQGFNSSENNDIQACWAWKKIRDLSGFITSGSRGWAKYYAGKGALFVRSQDIKTDSLVLNDVAYVDLPNKTEGRRTKITKGDLLITITGANVAKAACVLDNIGEAYVSQHVGLIRLDDSEIARYVHLWMISSNHGRKQLLDNVYGVGKPGLNLDNLKNVDILCPPKDEQMVILQRVQQYFIKICELEKQYSTAKKYTDKLEQLILAKAFRGELVR